MESLQCLIANMPQQLLVDMVQSMAKESGTMEVTDQVSNIAEIPSAMASKPIDALIMGMTSTELPRRCVDLLDRVSNCPILGLVDDGRRLALYMDNVGKKDIVTIVKALQTLRNGHHSEGEME